jgi:hypothetical protein
VLVANTGFLTFIRDMQRYKLSKKSRADARTWQTICVTLTQDFGGNVRQLIALANTDALELLGLIRGKYASGFPFLKGEKIALLWVLILHDSCGVKLNHLADVALRIDIHTAQAAIQTGCVTLSQDHGTIADSGPPSSKLAAALSPTLTMALILYVSMSPLAPQPAELPRDHGLAKHLPVSVPCRQAVPALTTSSSKCWGPTEEGSEWVIRR